MAVYSKVCFVEMPEVGTVHGGTSTEPKWVPFTVTTSGTVHKKIGNLTSGTATVLYDASSGTGSSQAPATFSKLWLWTDTAAYVQLIASSGTGYNVIHQVAADDPFELPDGGMLCAANETATTGGSVTTKEIQKVLLSSGGGTGTTAYIFFVAL